MFEESEINGPVKILPCHFNYVKKILSFHHQGVCWKEMETPIEFLLHLKIELFFSLNFYGSIILWKNVISLGFSSCYFD